MKDKKDKDVVRDIIEKNGDQIRLNSRLLDLVDSAIENINKRNMRAQSLGLFKGIVLVLFARCRKQFKAVQILCKEGYGEDACLILRSMINALIDISYIKTDPMKLAKRYVEFDWIAKKKKLNILNKYPSSESVSLPSKKHGLSEKDILKEAKQFNEDFPDGSRRSDWSGLKIEEKARKAKNNTLMLYDMGYRYYSDFDHSNIMSLSSHVDDSTTKGKFIVLSEPSEKQVQMNLSESFNIFVSLFDIYCETFELDYSNKIRELFSEYEKLLQKRDTVF
ncbi:MAG: DUF5677 domain-containing protein [Candidatus Omnitrophota bacterium]